MVWSGLGINYYYGVPQAQWDADIAYFRSLGINKLRIGQGVIDYPYTLDSLSGLACAKYFKDAGFSVYSGIASLQGINASGSPITATNMAQYMESVLAHVQYLQANNIIFDDFSVGNELENFIDGTTITNTDLYNDILTLASNCKAAYSGPVSYSFSQGHLSFWPWKDGIGLLDSISIHPYGLAKPSGYVDLYSSSNRFANVLSSWAQSSFGSKVIVTEFNLDAISGNFAYLSTEQQINAMRKIYSLLKQSVSTAFLYTWAGTGNNFVMKNDDGSFNPSWFVLLADGGRLGYTNS